MDLVVNEWLPEYFRPEASRDDKLLLEKFLNRFLLRNDRIVVQYGSEFLRKIYRYAKDYQNDDKTVNQIRRFIKAILKDPNRCKWVDKPEKSVLPDEIQTRLSVPGTNFHSDTYLFESASYIIQDKIIVTTDKKLIEQMAGNGWCKTVELATFLQTY